jgi:hypothetical protein
MLLWQRPNKGVMRSFLGSVARQWLVSNNREEFSLGSILRTRCHGRIILLVQPELQEGEVGRSRHAEMKQLKTEIKWKWSTLCSYHCCVHGVSTGIGVDSWGWILGRGKMFLFSTTSRPVQGHTQPPIQWVVEALSRGMKTLSNYDYLYIMP